ncbi:MAG: hypothetical protein WBD20_22955 [Pirellulaceae bacterium]
MLSTPLPLLVVLSLLSTSLCFGQDSVDATSPATVESIVAGLTQAESSVETLAVNYRGKTSSSFGTPFASLRRTFTERWHVDSSGRGWNESKGTNTQSNPDESVNVRDFHRRCCFDGHEGRCWTINSSGIGTESHSGSVQPTLMRHAVSPFDVTILHQGKSIAEHISDGAKVIGQQPWDGCQVTVVQTKAVENGSQYMTRYWVDPARNFTVVRRRNFTRETPEAIWKVTYSVDCFKHAKSKVGLWLPRLAWVQMFALSPDETEQGNTLHRTDVRCDAWSINEVLDARKLHFDFPPGLQVRGLAKDESIKKEKSSNFFVQPINTPLQKKIIGSEKYSTYAKIDVTAYADVNTKQIDPSKFDFDAFRKELKAAVSKAGDKHAHLFLSFDYGALGTDSDLGLFTKTPVVELAKTSGFASVRTSHTYHGGGQLWQGLPESPTAAGEESDLGDHNWHVYCVGTSLSRELIDDVDCVIISKQRRPIDVEKLIDGEAIKGIAKSLEDVDIEGKSLRIMIQLGEDNTSPDAAEELLVTKRGSTIQTKTIDALREIGFGDIRLAIQIGYGTFNSDYQK